MPEDKLCLLCSYPMASESLRFGVRYWCERCRKYEIIVANSKTSSFPEVRKIERMAEK